MPGEQFGIGGASSVRGYEEREITGDRGIAAALELVSPELATLIGMASGTLRAIGFADVGWVRNRLGTPCRSNDSECRLGSVGVGVRYGSGRLQARLDVAYALRAGNPHRPPRCTRARRAQLQLLASRRRTRRQRQRGCRA